MMNIVIDQKQFLKSLTHLKGCAFVYGGPKVIEIEGTPQGDVHLRAEDCSGAVVLTMLVDGTVGDPGVCAVPLDKLPPMLRHMGESVPVSAAENDVVLGSPGRTLTLPRLSAAQRDAEKWDREIVIDGTRFAQALEMVGQNAANSDDRPNLCAVSIDFEDDGAQLVATDGFRLAIADLGVDSRELAGQLLISPDQHKRLIKIVKPAVRSKKPSQIWVRWTENDDGSPERVGFDWVPPETPAPGFVRADITAPVMDATYPDWRSIAGRKPSDYADLSFMLDDGLGAVKAASELVKGNTNIVQMSGSLQALRIFSEHVDRRPGASEEPGGRAVFESVVSAQGPMDGIETAFNGSFLTPFLEHARRYSDTMNMHVCVSEEPVGFGHAPRKKSAPIHFSLPEQGYRFLLMPMSAAR